MLCLCCPSLLLYLSPPSFPSSPAYQLRFPSRVEQLLLISPAGIPTHPQPAPASAAAAELSPTPNSAASSAASSIKDGRNGDAPKPAFKKADAAAAPSYKKAVFEWAWEKGWSPFAAIRSELFLLSLVDAISSPSWISRVATAFSSVRSRTSRSSSCNRVHHQPLSSSLRGQGPRYVRLHLLDVEVERIWRVSSLSSIRPRVALLKLSSSPRDLQVLHLVNLSTRSRSPTSYGCSDGRHQHSSAIPVRGEGLVRRRVVPLPACSSDAD